MTDTDNDPARLGAAEDVVAARAASRARINEITALFNEITVWIREKREKQDLSVNKTDDSKVLAKMGELQTVHTMLLRAEEAFHDKFSINTAGDTIDYDRIRDDIGRQIDRIRNADRTGDVSEGPE